MQQYQACPHPLAGITGEILSFLEPLKNNESLEHKSGASEISVRLSTEVVDLIIKWLPPFENPPRTVTRILPPSVWRDFLFSGKLLPWLWDPDSTSLGIRRSGNVSAYDVD